MASLRETALAYEAKTTKVISDLKSFKANLDVKTFEGEKKDGEEFSYQYVEVEGGWYRIPEPVLAQMKVMLEDNPEITDFKVKKTGEGIKTVYTVLVA